MNPSSKETPGLNLPPPVGDQVPIAASGKEANPESPESLVSAPEKRAGAAAPPPSTATQGIPLPTSPSVPLTNPQNDVASTSQTASQSLLDDSDLIEKEWVSKAKQIVEHTRSDPHQQSEELTMFKADYMKKRYGKTIKLNK